LVSAVTFSLPSIVLGTKNVSGYWSLVAGTWMLDAGCSMLDTGYSILDELHLPTGQNVIENRVSNIEYHGSIIP
jgi:hypothetical protein